MKTLAFLCCLTFIFTVVSQAEESILQNPGFENTDPKRNGEPADWFPFAESGEVAGILSVQTTGAKEGIQCVRLGFDQKTSKFLGMTQRVQVQGGKNLNFTVHLKNVSLRDDSYVQLSLEWVGADGKEISRSWGPVAKTLDLSSDEWRKFELTATAPDGTAAALAVVTVFPASGTDGAILVDDVKLAEAAKK
jgi:hypothetical protein